MVVRDITGKNGKMHYRGTLAMERVQKENGSTVLHPMRGPYKHNIPETNHDEPAVSQSVSSGKPGDSSHDTPGPALPQHYHKFTRHNQMDSYVERLGLDLPEGWSDMTLEEKSNYLDERNT